MPERGLAVNRWFLNTHREWIELIIAAALLWLLMMSLAGITR
jgi:hypothetical protein